MFEMGTGVAPPLLSPKNFIICYLQNIITHFFYFVQCYFIFFTPSKMHTERELSPRLFSTGQLNGLLPLTPPAYQPDRLSGALTLMSGIPYLEERFTLRCFQRLPYNTWLPSYAFGKTTGTPVVCPFRSSRTKNGPSQVSFACDG